MECVVHRIMPPFHRVIGSPYLACIDLLGQFRFSTHLSGFRELSNFRICNSYCTRYQLRQQRVPLAD